MKSRVLPFLVALILLSDVAFADEQKSNRDDDGCHYDSAAALTGGPDAFFDSFHCHRTEKEELRDLYILAGGAVITGILLWRANRKRKSMRSDAMEGTVLETETGAERFEDIMRRQRLRFGLAPVENSRGRIDGGEFLFTLRF